MATVLDTRGPSAPRPRHPEKAGREPSRPAAKPSWIRVRATRSDDVAATREVVRRYGLVTVCDEAACPNTSTCWADGHATFMVMGDTCTRACAFCNVRTGLPGALDPTEPERLAEAARHLGLGHIVVTSVDRDDLPDGGAAHFAAVVAAIRRQLPAADIELLAPDFLRKTGALAIVVTAAPDVLNHNVETVPRLYPTIRPGARYYASLRLLDDVKRLATDIITKSGVMLGLGETREEVLQVMDDLRTAGVDILTLGQYLQPTTRHAPVDRFVTPEEFDSLRQIALAKGFAAVASSPLTRSSHRAGELLEQVRQSRA